MRKIASDVFSDEVEPLRLRWKEVVLAVKSTPFCKVVGYIKSCRGWRGILVIDEADSLASRGRIS
jgi:hypothetical protein